MKTSKLLYPEWQGYGDDNRAARGALAVHAAFAQESQFMKIDVPSEEQLTNEDGVLGRSSILKSARQALVKLNKETLFKRNKERFMNVTSIFGGPRKKGNTATVLSWVETELKSQGHQVERINLTSNKLNGCISCYKCKENLDTPGCVQKDDGPYIIDQMVASDIVIYASPLYYWGFSAQMKALIDRCYCLYRGECGMPNHTSFVDGQRQALIVTAADPFENNAEQVLMAFQRMLVYNKTHSAGELLVCNSTTPEELGDEVKSQATKFANQLFAVTQTPYALLIPGGALKLVPKVE